MRQQLGDRSMTRVVANTATQEVSTFLLQYR